MASAIAMQKRAMRSGPSASAAGNFAGAGSSPTQSMLSVRDHMARILLVNVNRVSFGRAIVGRRSAMTGFPHTPIGTGFGKMVPMAVATSGPPRSALPTGATGVTKDKIFYGNLT